MLVVDASVWIDFFNGRPHPAHSALRRVLEQGDVRIVMPDLTLYEVLRGFRLERDHRQARALMNAFEVEACGGEALAVQAADHYRSLRAVGVTVRSAIDVLLASFCIDRGYALLHADPGYTAFEQHRGLRAWPR